MEKRDAIVHAAIQVFKEQGIEKTKISDIVKNAHIAQGTFYLYFSSKLALMPAIAEEMVIKIMEVVRKNVNEKDTFSQQVEQLVDAIFFITEEYHEIQAVIYSGLASTEHLKEWESVYEPFYKWLSDLLQKAKEQGVIRETIRPEKTAKLMIGLIESAAEQIYLYDRAEEEEAAVQKAEVNEMLKYALGIKESE